MICLKLATRTGSFQVEVDATPADCGVANINYERKPLAVPGTRNTGTNYADSRYQLPQIDNSYEDKVSRILAISGTWMNAASGSQWALGPLSSTAYSERVGIGVRWGEIAFSPLLNVAENLIDAYPTWPGVLKEFAENQEFNRDYFSQRLKDI